MESNLSPMERRVFEALVRLRGSLGVSPTLAEIGKEISPIKPLQRMNVLGTMRDLKKKGWVEEAEVPSRKWLPSWESRMVERHSEILRLLDALAEVDSSAESLLDYILDGRVAAA